MNELKEALKDLKVRAKLGENIGLGIFVNGIYGISDGSVEFFNVFDIIIGIIIMLYGIILQRRIEL